MFLLLEIEPIIGILYVINWSLKFQIRDLCTKIFTRNSVFIKTLKPSHWFWEKIFNPKVKSQSNLLPSFLDFPFQNINPRSICLIKVKQWEKVKNNGNKYLKKFWKMSKVNNKDPKTTHHKTLWKLLDSHDWNLWNK